MKPIRIISATACAAIQFLVFIHTWNYMVSLAINQGRRMRGGVAYGITLHYSGMILCGIMVVSSLIAASSFRLKNRALSIAGLSAAWFFFIVFPHLDHYPIRGLCFGVLGVTVHLSGCFVIIAIRHKGAPHE